MGFQFRKLLSDSENGNILTICVQFCELNVTERTCPEGICLTYCCDNYPNYYLDKLPSTCSSPSIHHPNPNKFLITGIVLASVFLLVCFSAFYVKFYSGSRRRRTNEEEEEQRNEIQFLDEDHGPVIDHPVWYINTIGLQPSVINSIAICKYKRGDGLVEGTDCSVCLSEFQEDETLRLLPKCSHAFHVSCIDTWLRSHTNCPMCRAPIIANSAGATTLEGNNESVSTGEEARIGVPGNDGESEREMEGEDGELRIGTEEEEEEEEELHDQNRRKRVEELNGEEEGLQPMRRSVSLDSLSAFNISQALANVHQIQSDRNSITELVKQSESNMGIVPKGISGNQRLLKFMASSSIGRSLQIGPSSLKRSISCGGKLFLSRYSRNSSSVLPL